MSIPKVFHAFWTGPPIPEAFQRFAEGWRWLHPAWEYKLWGEGDLPLLQNQDLYDRAGELCPGFEGQFRSDVVRYELLHQFGGVWIDLDFECLRPVDDLLSGVDCFAAYELQGRVVGQAFMGCEPGHPFVKHLVDDLPVAVRAFAGKRPAVISGPHYITRANRLYPGELTVFDQKYFFPVTCKELHKLGYRRFYPDAYALHWWNNQHRMRHKPLDFWTSK